MTTSLRHASTVSASSRMINDTIATMQERAIEQEGYGKTKNGDDVTLFTITNKNGFVLKMIDYGATVVSLEVPDKEGELANIVLTCDGIEGFQACQSYFNGSVGRYCNRIAKGKFSIDGKEYQLATNNGPNHLHGGNVGYDKLMWNAEPFENETGAGVTFKLKSADGDEGYPGNVDVSVTYTLTDNDEFVVEFRATTDAATHVNLTNHNYWNLAGSGKILDHKVKIHANKYIPVDGTGIPEGEPADVAGTPFDFTEFTAIGDRIDQVAGDPTGYDHCYIIAGDVGELRPVAEVIEPNSGRKMEIVSTEPGLQFYSGNFLDGSEGSGGYERNSAFCMETQHYPDTPNRPDFPSSLLKPGEKYFHKTVHKFSIAK
ncbi:MAG: aldose epimerase family protein [Pirellulaceae bacterium]